MPLAKPVYVISLCSYPIFGQICTPGILPGDQGYTGTEKLGCCSWDNMRCGDRVKSCHCQLSEVSCGSCRTTQDPTFWIVRRFDGSMIWLNVNEGNILQAKEG